MRDMRLGTVPFFCVCVQEASRSLFSCRNGLGKSVLVRASGLQVGSSAIVSQQRQMALFLLHGNARTHLPVPQPTSALLSILIQLT